MIRLIASDVDGTLLNSSAKQLSHKLFDIIEQLNQKGVYFCAASGRQYESLRRLFAPVAGSIIYSCENGSIVYYKDKIIGKTPLPQELCRQLAAQLLAQPKCEVLLSGANTSYIIPKSDSFYRHIKDELGNNTICVKCIDEIGEEIIKVSAFTDKPAPFYEAMFSPVWNRHLNVAVAGKHWLDFTLAHKGTALAQIGEELSISSQDMLVFGDNFNDIPMFRFAGKAYAMDDAIAEVKNCAHSACSSVEAVLEDMLLKL